MTVLLQHLWPALALVALLGFAFALLFGPGAGLPSARPDVTIGAAALACACGALAWSETVPGRPGLWLDIAVACCLAYAVGIGAGTGARWLAGRLRTRTREGDEAA